MRPKVELCLTEIHLQLRKCGLGGIELRLGKPEARLGNAVVEHGKELTPLDHHALFHQHVDHLGRHLGTDGGLSPRHYIASCVEHAVAGHGTAFRLHKNRLDRQRIRLAR